MAKGELSLIQLANDLESRTRVSYRLMLRKADDKWTLQAMIADAGTEAPSKYIYDYGRVAFIGGVTRGVRVSSWLLKLKGKAGNFSFLIPKLQENIFSDRYPSHISRDIFLRLPQPFSLNRIHISGKAQYGHDNDPLVKDGCPSFPTLAAAAEQLLYDRQYESGRGEPEDIIVRIAHTEAWIELVHLMPSAVSITIAGTDVRGARLEVGADPTARFDLRLRKSGMRRFPLPRGLPQRLFIVLSRGDRWLDYRNLDLRGGTAATGNNVVADLGDDCAQVEGLIARGESETREFKQEISNDKRNTFLKTVAAFANGSGGVILFGVADNAGDITGIGGNVQKEKERIINMIRDTVVPRPNLRIVNCRFKGKQVIALFIEEGDSPPYGLDAARPTFYIRRGSTTFPANQAEIRIFARKSDSQPYDYPFRLSGS